MSANSITLIRIVLSVVVVVMFGMNFEWRMAAIVLTIIVFYMDSLDGYITRKLGVASDFGALFDITGDRIVEHVYWIFFTAVGLVSVWVPIIFIARSFLVDTIRSVAFSKEGKTPFGEKSMMRSSLTRYLTSSRSMRGLYGFIKVFVFMLLGGILILETNHPSIVRWIPPEFQQNLTVFTHWIVWITVAMNLLRGLPVIWDGKYYLFTREYPRQLKDAY